LRTLLLQKTKIIQEIDISTYVDNSIHYDFIPFKVPNLTGEGKAIWFEHPTRVEPKLNISWDLEHGSNSGQANGQANADGSNSALVPPSPVAAPLGAPLYTVKDPQTGAAVLPSPGWMTRQKAQVMKVYGPHQKGDEALNKQEGWELGVRHLL
jgi:hypothetical protein